jgi:hypothetical protein
MLISTRLDHLGNMLRPEKVLIFFHVICAELVSFPTSPTAFGAIFWINPCTQHCRYPSSMSGNGTKITTPKLLELFLLLEIILSPDLLTSVYFIEGHDQ